jgi:quinol monooxygenase YgiN
MKIKRLVKLTIREDSIDDFLEAFTTVSEEIKAQDGCLGLQLLEDFRQPGDFFTISEWQDAQALEKYRQSDTFRSVWPKVKRMFGDRALAWSLVEVPT